MGVGFRPTWAYITETVCSSFRCCEMRPSRRPRLGYAIGVMNPELNDTEAVIARTVELLGGPNRAREVTDAEFHDMQRRWNQDVDLMGRILRAHLYVEHFLSEHIKHANPRLGSLATARLSFAQKLHLMDSASPGLVRLKPGIARLNKIRNRLAHNLSAAIEPDDLTVFLQAPFFATMRFVALGRPLSTLAPVEIMEQFAQFAAHSLSGEYGAFSKAFGQAVGEAKARKGA